MPQARPELRDQFFKRGPNGELVDDGIGTCEAAIVKAGGEITKGKMYFNQALAPDGWDKELVLAAIEFLCSEWDYAYYVNREEEDWLENNGGEDEDDDPNNIDIRRMFDPDEVGEDQVL